MSTNSQTAASGDTARAGFAPKVTEVDDVLGDGIYAVTYTEPVADRREEFLRLRAELQASKSAPWWDLWAAARTVYLQRRLADIPQEVRWTDTVENLWCLEGMEAVLTHALKGSSYSAVLYMGLIDDTGYGYAGANGSGVDKDNLASAIVAAGSSTPANGWNEVPNSTVSARGVPSFGSASSSGVNSDLVTVAEDFATLETNTIKGCFMLIKSKGGTDPTGTVGNTSGALLSAGLFTGGDQAVSASGTLSVTYTARLTTV